MSIFRANFLEPHTVPILSDQSPQLHFTQSHKAKCFFTYLAMKENIPIMHAGATGELYGEKSIWIQYNIFFTSVPQFLEIFLKNSRKFTKLDGFYRDSNSGQEVALNFKGSHCFTFFLTVFIYFLSFTWCMLLPSRMPEMLFRLWRSRAPFTTREIHHSKNGNGETGGWITRNGIHGQVNQQY